MPTVHIPCATTPYKRIYTNNRSMSNYRAWISKLFKYILTKKLSYVYECTAITTVTMVSSSLRIQSSNCLVLIRLIRAHWSVPKTDKITVLEYGQGYLTLILACISIQELKSTTPVNKNKQPLTQFSCPLWLFEIVACSGEFVNGMPWYIVRSNPPTKLIKVPRTTPYPIFVFKFSFSNLQ